MALRFYVRVEKYINLPVWYPRISFSSDAFLSLSLFERVSSNHPNYNNSILSENPSFFQITPLMMMVLMVLSRKISTKSSLWVLVKRFLLTASLRKIEFLLVDRRGHWRVTMRSNKCGRQSNAFRSPMDDEVRRFQRRVLPEILLSNAITLSIFISSLYGYLPWKVMVGTGSEHVSLRDRLAFTLQWSFLDLLPVLICIFAVFNRRRQTWAINPVDPRGEEFVRSLKGILENTLEQFIVKFILSLVLCTVLRSRELILLPTFTFLYLLGRITFALGYPTHRSFGMSMNFLSVLLVCLLIARRLLFKGLLFQSISWK